MELIKKKPSRTSYLKWLTRLTFFTGFDAVVIYFVPAALVTIINI